MRMLCLIVRFRSLLGGVLVSRCRKFVGSVELGCKTRIVDRPSAILVICGGIVYELG
jgi:hypothetical protein